MLLAGTVVVVVVSATYSVGVVCGRCGGRFTLHGGSLHVITGFQAGDRTVGLRRF